MRSARFHFDPQAGASAGASAGDTARSGASPPFTDSRLRIGHDAAETPEAGALPPAIVVPSQGNTQAPERDIPGALWRRKGLITLVTILVMAILSTIIMLVPNSYQASSLVIVEGERPAAGSSSTAAQPPDLAPETLGSEVQKLLSEDLLYSVATRLDLTHNPEFAESGRKVLLGRVIALLPPELGLRAPAPPSPDRALAETVAALRDRLTVGPVSQSRVLRITMQAKDPVLAAGIANTLATAYVDSLKAAKAAETTEAHRWLEKQVDELRDRSTRSALAYEDFRRANGLVRGKDSTIPQEQLTQLSAELTRAQQSRIASELALSGIDSPASADLDQLGAATGSPLLAKLREQLSEATGRLAELQVTAGPAMPSVITARAQVAAITRAIAQERERIRQTLTKRASVAEATEQRLQAMLTDLKAKMDAFDTSTAEAQALERTANADRDLYTNILARAGLTDPDLTYQSASARILSRAVVPFDPSSPNRRMLLPVALIVSLGCGVVAGFVRDTSRKGIHNLRDLPGGAALRLGLLPRVPKGNVRMAMVLEEAVAQVLARVLLARSGRAPASIVVTSPLPKEGKTRTAIALAKVAKDRGLRVLLVDGDMRTGGLSKAAGLAYSDRSMVRLLRDEVPADEADIYNSALGLSILPAGIIEESPMRLLANGGWEVALRELEQNYDLIIIDTPPVLASGDTWLLARPADATIMVAKWGATPPAALELALEQLATIKAGVTGVLLTMVSPREHASYGYDDSVLFSPTLMRRQGGRKSA